ncbi:hypothetical protein OBBRIDRAFT_774513 [Obba rivulosa]|uniref:YEATS domain-containing protein n=1 Tax=Obba rivulosa TaxID=1052685 RepID=A0A8E2B3Z1_9APHY|nr:hypothetical protein OBBRIDRAFT_774513 [Obba rivulosa]
MTSSYSPSYEVADDSRPMKRRKTTPETYVSEHEHSHTLRRQVILEEVDLEIGLRKRLSETVQSRLTWALVLQETLNREFRSQASGSFELRDAAFDALDAVEEPCSILWDREPRLPTQPPIIHEAQHIPSSTTRPDDLPAAAYISRPSTIRTRGLPRTPLQPVKKLLFLRNTHADPPEVVKLVCPDCSRSDFSNLQGLLNHCRIRHNREYGSHDECIRSCAVLVPEEERDWVIANGIELAGVNLPGLRRLFEIAVGAGGSSLVGGIQDNSREQEKSNTLDVQPTETVKQEPERTSTPITTTLGYHEDTPALALFLGRAPKKRVIHVHGNEDDEIDIFDHDGSVADRKPHEPHWHMRRAHRNIARPGLDISLEVPEVLDELAAPPADAVPGYALNSSVTPVETLPATATPPGSARIAGTRFHIIARVTIADTSRWITPARRPQSQPHHTHQWRLAVSSPSYSLHITSVLQKLTITCVTDPPPSTMNEPVVITDPPFAVTSTTDKPFLAKLTFTWAGDTNPPTDVEHWVELDPMHTGYPVLGEEQVLDIELDRNTELLPVRDTGKVVTWDAHLLSSGEVHDVPVHTQSGENSAEPDYAMALKSLLPQFPMTLRDVKGRVQSQPPYTLVSNPNHFRKMVVGRRKAIEVSRARALRDAYEQYVTSHPRRETFIPLSTADVYHWLEDEGLFPRAAGSGAADATERKKRRVQETDLAAAVSEVFCRRCGLHRQYHPTTVKSEVSDPVPAAGAVSAQSVFIGVSDNPTACMSFSIEDTKLPLFDANQLMFRQLSSAAAQNAPYGLSPTVFAARRPSPAALQYSSRDLVASADPRVIIAIRSLLTATGLVRRSDGIPSFIDPSHLSDLSQLPRSATEDALATHALLALLTRCMVRLLVRGGLDTIRRDEEAVRGHIRPRRRVVEQVRRVLSPSHVLRGLTLNAQRRLADSAALLLLARLGLPRVGDTMRDRDPSSRADENVEQPRASSASVGDSSLVAVKTEENDSVRLFAST